jgi:methylenetetrahydrofolate--tRNA-(uracil-5-)-methyltransferase
MVGFQTHLKWGAQKELLKLIPGLEKASVVRYGVMHLNTYLNSPDLLNPGYQLKTRNDVFFAGQMTGVEGYVESASSGLVAGINMARLLEGKPLMKLSPKTATGALALYVTNKNGGSFDPMNVNFGIFEELAGRVHKKERKAKMGERAIETMKELIENDYN